MPSQALFKKGGLGRMTVPSSMASSKFSAMLAFCCSYCGSSKRCFAAPAFNLSRRSRLLSDFACSRSAAFAAHSCNLYNTATTAITNDDN